MYDSTDAVAVVGMAGRFAGAPDVESLWTLMIERREGIRPVPADRWDAARRLDPDADIQAVGGFLDGVDQFDAGFFGISPREAAAMDPQQRLLLETAWRAVEDAGRRTVDLADTPTGVYVGAAWHDYETLRKNRGGRHSKHSLMGESLDLLSARISYYLRLRGPSMTVATGCSSSLVALHLAVQALRQGEIATAIVGGVNLLLAPDGSIGLTHFGGLSPDGRCAAFSASANGFVRGEGVAAVCLKTLASARADGDRIHGIIVGTAVNNDGGGHSLPTPNQEAHEELLESIYGGAADSIAYLEAHGTGTKRGDPIEAMAIGRAVGRHRTSGPLPIGSVKTNIGHTEPAAGLAGLFKVLLALRHRVVPPSLHAEVPNPDIPFEDLNLRVLREPLQLPAGDVRLGVSSFGWGGTNAHVVVAGPPEETCDALVPENRPARLRTGLPTLVPLSAQEQAVLTERIAQLAEYVPDDTTGIAEFAGTLAWRRDHYSVRAATFASTPDELSAGLAALSGRGDGSEQAVVTGSAVSRSRVAFVFPGQGSQWSDMATELYRDSPLFAEVVERCAEALSPHVSWDPLAILSGKADDAWLERVDMVQPVLWAMSLGLARLWQASGVEPDVVIGHSQGEIAAATLAGILSYEDAALVVARRSALVRRTCGRGRMLAVDLDRDAALAAIGSFEGRISLAAHNGPTSCVLSGEGDALLVLKEALDAEGTYCRFVNVDYASHSAQMLELRDDLLTELAPAVPRRGTVELLSTVHAAPADGSGMDAGYWVENLCRPVQFADTLARALNDGVTHVVEISPHPLLTPAVEQLAAEHERPTAALITLRRGDGGRDAFARALARGYVSGLEPFGDLPRCRPVPLPAHPLRPERHWLPDAAPSRRTGVVRGLDLVLEPAPGEPDVWHAAMDLAVEDLPWLADHQVHDTAVLPGVATLTLALDTARARTGSAPRALHDVSLSAAVPFGAGPTRLAVEWREDISEGGSFRLLSLPEGSTAWTEHAWMRAGYREDAADLPGFPAWLDGAQAEDPDSFYRTWAERGLRYGPAFRSVRSLYRRHDGQEVAGEAVLPEGLRPGEYPHLLHPALWDGALQMLLLLCEQEAAGAALMVTGIRRVRLPERPDGPVTKAWFHAVRHSDGALDVHVFDGERRLVLVMAGVGVGRLAGADPAGVTDAARLHRLRWIEVTGSAEGGQPPDDAGLSESWLVCGDAAGLTGPLADALAAHGRAVTRVSVREFLDLIGGGPAEPAGVVFAVPPAEAGFAAQQHGLIALIDVVRACTGLPAPPHLVVVTARGQAAAAGESPDPGAALYWGYARVLRREHGELRSRIVDVDPAGDDWAGRCAAEILGGSHEDQVALRGRTRLAARLSRDSAVGKPDVPRPPLRATRQPVRAVSTRPGLWEGVEFLPMARRAPGPHEIEVEVTASGINFLDVMKALGTYPDTADGARLLGRECAGRVVGLGSEVTGYAHGDRVIACAPGSLASYVTVRAEHARPIPDRLGDEEAAALPAAMATAWYGLVDLARLERGETVLIHSAAGGVGLAAVQVAQLLGARVIATAGSRVKRRYLSEIGVGDVFDSHDLGWVSSVRAATGGRGVDVVLNSLAGAAIPAGLDVLAEDGRFIELGKKDIHGGRRLDLASFRKGVGFFAVDLAGLMDRRPRRFARILADVWDRVGDGTLAPLPVRSRTFGEAVAALREMARGEHIGKFVVIDPSTAEVVPPVALPDGRLRAAGTYLVTGGLGALGLSLAEFLAGRGAGALALLGRSAPGADAERRIAALRHAGTQVKVVRCDVSDEQSLRDALREVRAELPPLHGVFHAAGVLADATIATMTASQVAAVLAPKTTGARNLDAATADDPLEMFVLFSSASVMVGNPGSAAYAAANAYLDALAESRRSRGLPALSVQWGCFADEGMAAEDERRGARLMERGLPSFPAHEAWPALIRMLERDEHLVGYVPLDLRQWFDAFPETAALASWELLHATLGNGHADSPDGGLRGRLLTVPREARAGIAEDVVRDLAARVLLLAPDRIGRDTPFASLGLDSLMSLELRNRLERAFGVKLSPTLLWTHNTVRSLSGALVDESLLHQGS